MIERCYQENHVSWRLYGGRGIKVCDRWKESFEAFLADMGEAPENMEIDRIDVNGGYCPENCRWATDKENARNKRVNRLLTYQNETRLGGGSVQKGSSV